jgi:hypothetical protein
VLSEPDEDKEEARLLPEEPEEPEEESHAVQDEVVVVGAAVTFAVVFVASALTSKDGSTILAEIFGGDVAAGVHAPSLQVQSPLHIVFAPSGASITPSSSPHFEHEAALWAPQFTLSANASL